MKKTTILLIIFILLAVIVLADTDDHTYIATVGDISNIIITSSNTSFGLCVAGTSCTLIEESLRVRNEGNIPPSSNMTGVFITNNATTYGLNASATDWMPGDNFALNGVAFSNDGINVTVATNTTLISGYDLYWNATLNIPTGQASGNYEGTIRLSWNA